MRNGRFTSYVALEFEDTEKKSLFTAGIVCDCYKDQSFDSKWFMLHSQGFPENLFVDPQTRTPYDIPGLRTYLSRNLGRKKGLYEFYETNKRYQEVTLGKFGQIKSKYRTLLRKAVPFSPIADIEKFITESICDVKNNIDVEQMQSDIRQYKSLEEDARQIQARIEALKEIRTISQNYEREKEKYLLQSFIVIRAQLEEYLEQEKSCRAQIQKRTQQIEENEGAMSALKEESSQLKSRLEKLEDEFSGSDIVRREKDLKRRLAELTSQIEGIRTDIHSALDR